MIEAGTWAGLLTGMYIKYIPGTTELGVRISGTLHGAAFIAYLLVTVAPRRHPPVVLPRRVGVVRGQGAGSVTRRRAPARPPPRPG